MIITERILKILKTIALYYCLRRTTIQELCLPGTGKDGAVARKILNELYHEKLINKTQCEVVNRANGSSAPVYYPSRKGCELLAQELRDDRWLDTCCLCPNPYHLAHWCEIARFRIVLDKAIALQADAQVLTFLHQWDVANPNEKDPAKKYRLFVELRKQPRLVCAPDAGFLLSYKGYKKVYFVEIDRSTTGVRQLSASKTPGYFELAKQGRHTRHFPETNVPEFSVLFVAPTVNRRDAVQRGIKEKDGARLWKFAAWTEITPETLLYGSILKNHEGEPMPLLRRVEGSQK